MLMPYWMMMVFIQKRLFNCCNCIWRIRWLRILLAVQFVTELCLKWKEFFFFGGNMLFNCLKWKAIFLLGTYWVCVSETEKERCWCWGIKVITYSCFFFFGKYIITEFSSSSSFLLRMVLVDQGDDLFLPFFFFDKYIITEFSSSSFLLFLELSPPPSAS